ncbi:MAG: hypothetical protein ABEJ40_10685 [Haloarculaceae archaeon]
MATTRSTVGMDHLTVVPENFDAAAERESKPADERVDDGDETGR